jgi:8-oxo-dGTP pyrophosphatase MutT (NUDIX family)
MSVHPWKKMGTKKLADYRVYGVRSDTKVSPRTGEAHEFFIIEAVHWVNVIPMTTEGKIVMVEQYRHGSDTIELEIPGGMMDEGETDPIATGLRELREETGYEGANARLIGQTFPNPAIMNNICHTVLVEQCVCKHPLKFDPTEDIHVVLVEPAEIPDLIRTNRIGHSLVVVAFYFWELTNRAAK